MDRTAERRGLRLTLWKGGDGPARISPGATGVEFRGQLGHPSSYGLLAGRGAGAVQVCSIDVEPPRPDEQLEVPIDTVHLGLPTEYAPAIIRASEEHEYGLVVTDAAHGRVGSSSAVSFTLTSLLIEILQRGDPAAVTDSELWTWWDNARGRTLRSSPF